MLLNEHAMPARLPEWTARAAPLLGEALGDLRLLVAIQNVPGPFLHARRQSTGARDPALLEERGDLNLQRL
eukprot:1268478-Lingulodinium_polyedra.AAC.1